MHETRLDDQRCHICDHDWRFAEELGERFVGTSGSAVVERGRSDASPSSQMIRLKIYLVATNYDAYFLPHQSSYMALVDSLVDSSSLDLSSRTIIPTPLRALPFSSRGSIGPNRPMTPGVGFAVAEADRT